jgi:acetyltransferase-like isoleucine patch superfamily enzyme
MDFPPRPSQKTHGDGLIRPEAFRRLGAGCVFEPGALVFHPENVELAENIYVGHYAILKGYFRGLLTVGRDSWIGPFSFLHGAGNLAIGRAVGIGPRVTILTSHHEAPDLNLPVFHQPLAFAPVTVGDGVDLGAGSIILPGVEIGEGAIIGAGAVVTKTVPPREVWAGTPARRLRSR